MTGGPDLAGRLADSPWVAAEPGLREAAGELAGQLGSERETLEAHAAHVARIGPVHPVRAAQHALALTTARWRWQYTRLPRDILSGAPFRDPAGYAKATIATLLRDHLASLGAGAAEVSRIIDASEGLLPGVIVEEVRRRPVRVAPMSGITVEAIVTRAFGDEIAALEDTPVAATAVAQIHRAKLASDGRSVVVRVRRPGVDAELRHDARIIASIAGALELAIPPLRDPHPLGFVELTTRQILEEADLRHEALNAVELALAVERLGIEGVVIPHPIPGLVDPRVVVFEDLGATPLDEVDDLDRDRVLRAQLAMTLEAALTDGVFHADLRPEHLAVLDDGSVTVTAFGTIGRFGPTIRRSAMQYLMAVFSGDVNGQIEAMRLAGAVPDEGVDTAALARDLEASENLKPMTMLTGGEQSVVAGLKEAVQILLRHRLRPPVEVTLFVRNVFALNAFVRELGPEMNLLSALMPLVQRLPELNAELATELDPARS